VAVSQIISTQDCSGLSGFSISHQHVFILHHVLHAASTTYLRVKLTYGREKPSVSVRSSKIEWFISTTSLALFFPLNCKKIVYKDNYSERWKSR